MKDLVKVKVDAYNVITGCYVYRINKNGNKSKRSFFVRSICDETSQDIIKRLEKLNPGTNFTI